MSMLCVHPRYRRWKLGDDIDLIVRCEHDGVMTGASGEVSFINIKTLNEWDSRVRLWAGLSVFGGGVGEGPCIITPALSIRSTRLLTVGNEDGLLIGFRSQANKKKLRWA